MQFVRSMNFLPPSNDDGFVHVDIETMRTDSLPRTLTGINRRALQALRFDDHAMLRGTPVVNMMHQFARVFGDQECTEAYYDLSERTDHIDAFISHNWSTPRVTKFFALAFHFNLVPALAISTAAAIIPCVLEAKGDLSTFTVHFEGVEIATGIWCQVVGGCTFLVTFFLGHEVVRLCGGRGLTSVFLDKTCVHQTDAELKSKGIASLAAFLAYSWSMVVLFSEVYLTKLWTVYEIATFLLMFPRGRLYVLPLFLPKIVISLMSLAVILRVGSSLMEQYYALGGESPLQKLGLESSTSDFVILMTLSLCPLTAMAAIGTWWAREQSEIQSRLATFHIRNATCQSEDDRRIVERNVAIFSKAFGFAPLNASQDACLEVFDRLVHQEVPKVLRISLGRVGMPYRYVVSSFVIYHFHMMDVFAACIHFQLGVVPTAMVTVMHIMVYTCIGPLGVAACTMIPKSLPRCKCSWLLTLFVSFPLITALQGVQLWMRQLAQTRAERMRFAEVDVIFWSICFTLAALTYGLYRRPDSFEQPRRQLRGDSDQDSTAEPTSDDEEDGFFRRNNRMPTINSVTGSAQFGRSLGCTGYVEEDSSSSDSDISPITSEESLSPVEGDDSVQLGCKPGCFRLSRRACG